MSNESVKNSDGVSGSNGVSWSNGVSRSYGVSWSNGVRWSNGVSGSEGVRWSNGVSRSYGVLNSFGVDCSIFEANKKRTFRCFGKDITEQRYSEIWDELHKKLNGWYPKFHNMFELYLKAGSDWKLTPVGDTVDNSKEKAWSDMPKEAVDYVKSLPEFDEAMFFEITGIKANDKVKITVDGVDRYISRESAVALGLVK